MEFRLCCWSILGCVLFVYNCGPGVVGVTTEPTPSSAIERKTCGNETERYYCHDGCCLDENKDEKCCHMMQVSDWCPLLNATDLYCEWGCCYHDKDEICCNFLTMKYSFLLIIAAILVSFFVFVILVTFISNCLKCSFFEPSYSRTF